MGFSRKKTAGTPKTSKAIAYLKAVAINADPERTIKLPHEDTPIFKELNSELLVAYLVDTGKSFEYVQYRDLRLDTISEVELHETGLKNLSAQASSSKLRVQPYGNIFAVFLDGNFEASLILLDDLWTGTFREFVQGEYLVAIPNRDILAFCDRSSHLGRAELNKVIDRLKKSQDHRLTSTLYRRQNGEWVPDTGIE